MQRRCHPQAAAGRELRRAPAPRQQADSSGRRSSRCPQRSAGDAARRARRRKLRRQRCQHAGRHALAAQCQARPPAAGQGAQRSSRRGRCAAGSSAELRGVHHTLKERAHAVGAVRLYRIPVSRVRADTHSSPERGREQYRRHVAGGRRHRSQLRALAAPVPHTLVALSALPRRAHAWPQYVLPLCAQLCVNSSSCRAHGAAARLHVL